MLSVIIWLLQTLLVVVFVQVVCWLIVHRHRRESMCPESSFLDFTPLTCMWGVACRLEFVKADDHDFSEARPRA
jgi:hypothetical protein